MKVKTIAIGSKGNCTIILCDNTNIIIDMGISYLTLKRSLEENSLSFEQFNGILVTHSHKDHINGLKSLVNHTNLTVYIPEKMYNDLEEIVPRYRCEFIEDKFSSIEKFLSSPIASAYKFWYDTSERERREYCVQSDTGVFEKCRAILFRFNVV